MSFTKKIIYSMILGIIIGLLINVIDTSQTFNNLVVNGIFGIVSQLFISSLKLIIIPLIFFSIVCGILSLSDDISLSRLGFKTLSLYLVTTVVAISLGLFISSFMNYESSLKNEITNNVYSENDLTESSIFPDNIFQSLAEGNIIHLLIFSVLIGIAANKIRTHIPTFISYITEFNNVINELVKIIISFTPIAVFCILAKTFASQGSETLITLMSYFLTVAFVLILHLIVTYSMLIKLFTKLNPLDFYKNIKNVIVFTFSTSSSSASIPFTLKTARDRCGINSSVSSFTIPLGATINMDGTAIMQGCATFFLAGLYGINIGLEEIILIVTTATLASIGTAGVPSAGILMLTLIFSQIGIPLEGITLLLGVDRLLDMMRTSVNVSGDICITCIVASSENQIDKEIFES